MRASGAGLCSFAIWDTPGLVRCRRAAACGAGPVGFHLSRAQESFRDVAPLYYQSAAAAVVVYDISSEVRAGCRDTARQRAPLTQWSYERAKCWIGDVLRSVRRAGRRCHQRMRCPFGAATAAGGEDNDCPRRQQGRPSGPAPGVGRGRSPLCRSSWAALLRGFGALRSASRHGSQPHAFTQLARSLAQARCAGNLDALFSALGEACLKQRRKEVRGASSRPSSSHSWRRCFLHALASRAGASNAHGPARGTPLAAAVIDDIAAQPTRTSRDAHRLGYGGPARAGATFR